MTNRIEICGAIAAGKTTLCQYFVTRGYNIIPEDFKNNPFLIKFYSDPRAFSFETEISFLLQHYHLIKTHSTNSSLACDFSLLLDLAYADVNLTGDRHRIFAEMASELQNEISLPSHILHISCPVDVLLRRIETRGRKEETSITIDYLKALDRAISLRTKNISNQISVISLDSSVLDFTSGIEGIQELTSL